MAINNFVSRSSTRCDKNETDDPCPLLPPPLQLLAMIVSSLEFSCIFSLSPKLTSSFLSSLPQAFITVSLVLLSRLPSKADNFFSTSTALQRTPLLRRRSTRNFLGRWISSHPQLGEFHSVLRRTNSTLTRPSLPSSDRSVRWIAFYGMVPEVLRSLLQSHQLLSGAWSSSFRPALFDATN